MTEPTETLQITEPGLYELNNRDYHRDPVPGGSLSATGAKTLLKNPARFDYERRHPVFKDAFDFGSAAHKYVLGDEVELLVLVEEDDWRKKAAQDTRREAREAGHIPMLRKDVDVVEAMAEKLAEHEVAGPLFTPGTGLPERSLFWRDEPTGIMLRCRPDWLPNPIEGRRMIVPDYKTAVDASIEAFAKAAANYAYHSAAVHYQDGIKALGIDPDPAFVLVVQEKEPPYSVAVYEFDLEAEDHGRARNRRAYDLFAEYTRSGVWPGYPTGVQELVLPGWYTYTEHEEIEI